MARIVGGIATSHVPTIGVAQDQSKQQTPEWKPLFDAYVPVREWLLRLKPDIAITVYNDHGAEFFFDHYPTFAVGAAESYPVADAGFGKRPLPEVPGALAFSWHLCESLVYDELDITVCQELNVDHGFLVPMSLCFDPSAGWPVLSVPVAVNVLRHPMPTMRRCYRLGQAIRRAVESFPQDARVVILGTGGMSHQLQGTRFGFLNEKADLDFLRRMEEDPESLLSLTHHQMMEQFGAEGIELIMWMVMRGAISSTARRVHSNYYAPMTTGMGLLTFEEGAE
jgi:Uncharacterized conserved protein